MKRFHLFISLFYVSILGLFISCSKDQALISNPSEIHNDECIHLAEGPPSNSRGRLVETQSGISYEVIDGEFWMGDIRFTQKQVDILNASRGAGLADLAQRWDFNMVPFVINANLPNRARVTQAIARLEANTNVRFVPREDEDNYIEFVQVAAENNCSSSLGMIGGRQEIRLENDCTRGNVMHEIGHALGLFHEHNRADRDGFVVITPANMLPGANLQYIRYDNRGLNGFDDGPFDFNSIMMYGSLFNSRNTLPTMTRIGGGLIFQQRNFYSNGDRNIINRMYPNDSWVVMYEGDDVEQDIVCGVDVSAGNNRINFTASNSPCTNDEVRSLRFINMRAGQTIALHDRSNPRAAFWDNRDDYVRIDILRDFDEDVLNNLELDKLPGTVLAGNNTWRLQTGNFRAVYRRGGNLDGKVSRFNSNN